MLSHQGVGLLERIRRLGRHGLIGGIMSLEMGSEALSHSLCLQLCSSTVHACCHAPGCDDNELTPNGHDVGLRVACKDAV